MRLSEEIFLFLQGQWQLERSINNHGTMKGIASFSPLEAEDSLSLFYREEGDHILQSGLSFSFFKEYIYCLNNLYIDVFFTNNKKRSGLFYKITFLGHATRCLGLARHCCNRDLYVATYQFFDRDRFSLQYNIFGPKKNVRIQTFFQR